MQLVDNLVPDYAATIIAARQVFGENNTLRDYFPIQNVEDVRYRLAQRNPVDVVGAVRNFDSPARQIRRGGVFTFQGELPAVSAMDTLLESDLIRARQLAGVPIASLVGDQVTEAAARVAIAIDNAYERLRGQVFSTGQLAIDNGEFIQGTDFGVPTDNKFTPGKLWSDSAADPIADLLAWGEIYANNTGTGGFPAVAVTSRKVFNTLLRHPKVLALFAVNGTAPALITPAGLNSLLDSYGLPTFRTYDRRVDGIRTTAENTITFLPGDGPIGTTYLGVTEQAVQLSSRGVLQPGQTPGVTIATLVTDHPVSRHVVGDALGLPVLTRPFAVGFATVLAA